MATSGERGAAGASAVDVTLALANPGAGADWQTNPTGTHQLVAVFAQLVTSATVANRLPALQILDPTGHIACSLPASSVQAASLTETYLWGQGLPFSSGQNANLVPLPTGLTLGQTWTIKTVSTALQAGDQWSAIVLTFSG